MGKKLKKNLKKLTLKFRYCHFLTAQHYFYSQTTIIVFECVDFCPKINLILYLFETWQPIPVSVRDSIQLGSLSYRKLALKIDPVIFRKARLFHNFKGLKLTKVVSELVKIIWTVRIHSRLQPPRSPEANIMFSKVDIRFVIMRQLRRFWKIK